jgi:acetylglutamate kinase
MNPSFSEQIRRADILVEALPYLQQFRGATVVVKYGGSAMEEPELIDRVLRDLVFLEAVGINPLVVHGGGKAITKRMAAAGLQARFVGGLRVTDEASIRIVDEVLNGEVNPDIVRRINAMGGNAVSVRGQEVFRAVKSPPVRTAEGEADLGFVGEVEGCRVRGVLRQLEQEIVPVVSPLGRDDAGNLYNVNADLAAAEIAVAVEADKLIYLSDVNGVLRDPADASTRIPTVTRADAARLKEEGVISGGMLPKIDSCLKALARGVGKVHMLDGRLPHGLLLELFTDRGIGTEIVEA